MTKQESLAKASKELMLTEPYYGLTLMSLNKFWDIGNVPTAGVGLEGINYNLVINSEFWNELSQKQKVGILKHELLHICFFHLVNYDHLTNARIRNIAMDIEINQYIDRDMLPTDGCFIEDFNNKGYNLETFQGTKYYYDALMEKAEDDPELGNVADGKSDSITMNDGTEIPVPNHDWDINDLPEATKKLIERQTARLVQEIAEQVTKARGTVPGELHSILKKLQEVEEPKFDWKGYMRRFVGKSSKTYTKKSRRKLNKRLPEFPGLKIKNHKHVLAAIDTSASVNTKELKEFLNELYHIKKTGAEVTILQCDTAISYIGKFDPRKDLEIHGRGGTEFQPVIDYYNEKQKEYSCLFYFTDGECSAPDNARGNILWVISSQGNPWDELPGTTIKLEL
jgi:predicted metal-dependent peptidase